MDIFVYTKFVLSSEFKGDSNALIFSLIKRELSELCEFYKLYPKMVIFHAMPSVLQMAVNVPELADLSIQTAQSIDFLCYEMSEKVEWFWDSGCTDHITPRKSNFVQY